MPTLSSGRRSLARLLLAVGVSLLLGACELSLASDIHIQPDGAGSFTFRAALDEELAALVEDAGIDATAGLREAADAGGWELDVDADDGLDIELRAAFSDPEELRRLVERFHGGLDAEDAAILEDVRLTVADDGAVRFSARAGLRLPSSTGAEGDGVEFDGDDLAQYLRTEGRDALRVELRVVLPGPVRDHDGGRVDGEAVVWELPPGELVGVSATSEAPADPTLMLAVATGLVVALAAAGITVLLRRRRARSRSV